VTRAGELFARGNKAPAVADAQKVINDLHRKIGQLQALLRQTSNVRHRFSKWIADIPSTQPHDDSGSIISIDYVTSFQRACRLHFR
jgi:hypothetical protein